MNAALEKLLLPVSDTDPCGPDLTYDLRYEELENLLKGTPEVDLGNYTKPAEPPDWGTLQEKSMELLIAGRHLRPAMILVACLLKTRGFAGFRDGVQLVGAMVEKFWPYLHPRLDPDDHNDPTRRLNHLSTLNAPRGLVSGWLMIQEYLATAPICRPPGTPGICFDELLQARKQGALTHDSTMGKALRAARPEELVQTRDAVVEAMGSIKAMDAFLTTTLSAGGTVGFDEVLGLLDDIRKTVTPFVPATAVLNVETVAGTPVVPVVGVASDAVFDVSGSIRSREEVVKALEAVADYYRQVEPGSPVPYLIRRAQKMATMNFVELMEELALANHESLKPAMGSSLGTPPAT